MKAREELACVVSVCLLASLHAHDHHFRNFGFPPNKNCKPQFSKLQRQILNLQMETTNPKSQTKAVNPKCSMERGNPNDNGKP